MTDQHFHPLTDHRWSTGVAFLGSRLAIMAGAMTWVSEHQLVSAISNAGAFGVLACGAMNPSQLEGEIRATQQKTSQPFGVNLIVMHPALSDLVNVCIMMKTTHVVLAGGLPSREIIAKLKQAGIKILCFAPSAAIGRKLVRDGADALIIEGHEAGGHVGPVATSVLAQEILPAIRDVPVFVAGGIGHGEAIAAYLNMGAAGVQMGTAFVCAEESKAHPAFKRAFVRAAARDAVVSVQVDPNFRVIPVRALANAGTERFTRTQVDISGKFRAGELTFEEASLAIEHYWAGALRRAVVEGDVENGSLMAGQSVGLVRKIQPATSILEELLIQTELALARDLDYRSQNTPGPSDPPK
ncbi:enoyl-[acyl-carrier protein] reductase II [Arboricoccus pini]|uniref:Enoyl-[acyl-carrier protein] reductase II n=1 Tax=Arboricoccus pini TaxID=1963835 RepID=A0A212R022_9PROT|nr:nitronate monooxygenase [Arboricoccus pini]SNB65296.1 enoyl-[acyl-carrier protein] reductase II [Arboricoccus pini]